MFLKYKSGCITPSKCRPWAAHLGLCTCPSLCLGGPLPLRGGRHITSLPWVASLTTWHFTLNSSGPQATAGLPASLLALSLCPQHLARATLEQLLGKHQERRPELGDQWQAATPHPPPVTPVLQLPGRLDSSWGPAGWLAGLLLPGHKASWLLSPPPNRWSSECWPRPAAGASAGTTVSCT